MGLNFPRPPRAIQEPSASITWCEYMAALDAATDPGACVRARAHPDGPARSCPVDGLEETETALLREQVRRRPEDETAHRLLGLGHLAHGRIGPAVRHLEIALRLVRGHARHAVGLTDALQRQCEAAVLRLVLLRLHVRLGNVNRASALAQEAQALL
jgi:hypothetical protein